MATKLVGTTASWPPRRKIAAEINEVKTTVAQHQATIELLYGQLEDRQYGSN
jgi:hypothetical protein